MTLTQNQNNPDHELQSTIAGLLAQKPASKTWADIGMTFDSAVAAIACAQAITQPDFMESIRPELRLELFELADYACQYAEERIETVRAIVDNRRKEIESYG